MQDSSATGDSLIRDFNGPPTSQTISGFRVSFDGISSLAGPTTAPNIQLDCIPTCLTLSGAADTVIVTGSGITYTLTGAAQNLPAGRLFLNLNNISPAPATPGQYSLQLTFINGTNDLWTTTLPYFVKGDGDIWTPLGNTIEVLGTGSLYRGVSATTFLSGALNMDTFLNQPDSLAISSRPIKNLTIREIGSNVIISYQEYTSFDCREGNTRSVDRIFPIRRY